MLRYSLSVTGDGSSARMPPLILMPNFNEVLKVFISVRGGQTESVFRHDNEKAVNLPHSPSHLITSRDVLRNLTASSIVRNHQWWKHFPQHEQLPPSLEFVSTVIDLK